jgi:hypothetical protein
MSSLWKKLSIKGRRRSSSVTKGKNLSIIKTSSNGGTTTKDKDDDDDVPVRTISMENSSTSLPVSPLKTPNFTGKKDSIKRRTSSALGTVTTQLSHSFWSDENDSSSSSGTTTPTSSSTAHNVTTNTTISTTTATSSSSTTLATTRPDNNNNTKIIPPRHSCSHWKEDDFVRVVQVWDLSQEEISMMRELEAKLYDITHWKNNPFEVVRFMKGPQGYKPAERLFRKMVHVSCLSS